MKLTLRNYRNGDIIYYLLSVVPFFLCASARAGGSVLGLSLGLYVALIYCRCNYLLISPMYVAGCALADASAVGLVYAATPVLVMGAAKLIHRGFARPMGLLAANIYAALSLVPVFALGFARYKLSVLAVSVAVNQIFCYCALLVCYAVIVRGVRNRLSADEAVGGAAVLTVLCAGLYSCSYGAFEPYYIFTGWCAMAAAHSFSPLTAAAICFSAGLGGAAASGEMSVCGAAVSLFAASYAFKKLNVWFAFAAVVITDLACGLLLGAYPGYGIPHIAELAGGAFLYAVLPRKARKAMAVYIPESPAVGARRIVAHNRAEVFARLTGAAKVFFEMGKCFSVEKDSSASSAPPHETVARETMLRTCTDCPSRQHCQKALGSDTSVLFTGAASSALLSGSPTAADLPVFAVSHCIRIPAALSNCAKAAAAYVRRKETAKQYAVSQQIVAEQMYGAGNVIMNIADDMNKGVSFDEKLENEIIEKLSYKNIVCTEAVIYTENLSRQASVTVRRSDARKDALEPAVSDVLGCKMQRCGEDQPLPNDKVNVSFCAAPRYIALYGECSAKKDGSDASGDSKSVRRLRRDKLFVAVCDGMGSGENARSGSLSTLSMVENFYRAGFGNDAALNMVNRMLMLRGGDEFSALDMCVIDLDRASADFVKLGGVQSFIKRPSGVEIIGASALPIGIVEEAVPYTESRLLSCGDSVVMVSDGVADALGADGIKLVLERSETDSPQELCDMLIAKATEYGAKDDSTAVAVRLIADAA